MPVDVRLDRNSVVIDVRGADMLASLRRRLEIPFADIVSARVDDVATLKPDLGIRVRGGYWPGRMITGRFTTRGRKGGRQFWLVYRDQEVLVIDTSRDRFHRVVVQHPAREELAREIDARGIAG